MTRCFLPLNFLNMRIASFLFFGLPMTSLPSTTTVSAPKIIFPFKSLGLNSETTALTLVSAIALRFFSRFRFSSNDSEELDERTMKEK